MDIDEALEEFLRKVFSTIAEQLASAGVKASGATLAAHMAHDKKKAGGRVPFILARGVGGAFVDKCVEIKDVAEFLDRDRNLAEFERHP